MLILVAMVLGAAIGLFTRYVLPGREWVGLFLNPTAAAAAAGVVWTAMALTGFGPDNGWIWFASLAAATVVAVAIPKILPARRARADARLLEQLRGTGRAA